MRKLRKILKVLWKIFERFVSILPFVFVFIASIYEPNDPDLGWHLKYGEYFFKHGQLLRDNTFSVMMPDYQWANTSWLIDLLTYAVFNYGGFPGITILGAIALTLTFFFFSKAANLSLWTQTIIFPILMFFLVPVIAVSFRGQILTFMMLGILFYIIRLYSNHPRLIYLTIPLFLVWSNLHGEFLLGIAMFAVWIFFYIFQGIYLTLRRINPYKKLSKRADIYNFLKFNRKEILKLMTVYILVLLATLINPFGYEPYLAAISHIGSPQLKDIVEYLPIEFMSPLWWQQVILLCVIGLVFLTVAMHEKLVPPIYFVIISLFLYSFDVRRYIWPVYFMILPLIKVIPDYFTPPKKIVTLVCFVLLSIYLAFTVHDKLPLQRYTAYNWTSYCQQMGCSPASLEFIQKNRLDKDLFSLYGWGGAG